MGIETAIIAVAAVSAVGEGVSQYKSYKSDEAALDLESKETQLQTQQKTLSNYDAMQKVLQAQQAHMTTTGAAFSSPSFNAIQRATLNIGAKQEANTEIEGSLEEQNIKIEKQNVRNKLYASLFGDVGGAAMGAAGAASKSPSFAAGGGSAS